MTIPSRDSTQRPSSLPINKPPYGTLTAIDLNTGDAEVAGAARRHAGDPQQSAIQRILKLPPLGVAGSPGPIVTAGGLMFVTGGGSTLYAIDSNNGATLWSADLGQGAYAVPMTYRTRRDDSSSSSRPARPTARSWWRSRCRSDGGRRAARAQTSELRSTSQHVRARSRPIIHSMNRHVPPSFERHATHRARQLASVRRRHGDSRARVAPQPRSGDHRAVRVRDRRSACSRCTACARSTRTAQAATRSRTRDAPRSAR